MCNVFATKSYFDLVSQDVYDLYVHTKYAIFTGLEVTKSDALVLNTGCSQCCHQIDLVLCVVPHCQYLLDLDFELSQTTCVPCDKLATINVYGACKPVCSSFYQTGARQLRFSSKFKTVRIIFQLADGVKADVYKFEVVKLDNQMCVDSSECLTNTLSSDNFSSTCSSSTSSSSSCTSSSYTNCKACK